jgi:outer membrane protein TolC
MYIHRKHLVFLLTSVSLLFPVASFAAADSELTLDKAIRDGLGESPYVQSAKSQAEEARWKKFGNLSLFLPSISASGTDITSQNYLYTDVALSPGAPVISIPNIVPTWEFSVTAQWSIFDGFTSTNMYRSTRSMQEAADDSFDWTKFRTEKEITLQFYRTLGSRILQDVAEQNLKTLEDHLKEVNLFKKAGVSTNYDVLRVEVQVSEARSEVMNTSDNVIIAKNKLAQVLGEDSESRQVVGELPVPQAELIRSGSLGSLETRKDLTSLKFKAEGLQHSEDASSRYWVPHVNLFGQYFYYNNRTNAFPDSNAFRDAYQVGVSLTWNIFDGMASIARSKVSVEQRYQAEKALRIGKLAALNDYDLWRRRFLYNCSVYKSRIGDVAKSEESVRLAREGRKVGSRTNTDLLDAESDLFRSKAGVVNAQISAIESLVNLELTTGQRLLK